MHQHCSIWRHKGGGYEQYFILGYDAVWSGTSVPRFGETYCLIFRVEDCEFCLLLAGCLVLLLSNPEDGGSMLLRNVCELLPDYTALHLRRDD
jgi:hypothetical protein